MRAKREETLVLGLSETSSMGENLEVRLSTVAASSNSQVSACHSS